MSAFFSTEDRNDQTNTQPQCCGDHDPYHNAVRLRAIVRLNPSSHINIDSNWALAIADQLDELATARSRRARSEAAARDCGPAR
jgi:hypothetical protein